MSKIVYGYVLSYKYSGSGNMLLQVRIPSIHGPYYQKMYGSSANKNYTKDEDIPYYESVLLPYTPCQGEVAMLATINDKSTEFVVIGLTGGSYQSGWTSLGEKI